MTAPRGPLRRAAHAACLAAAAGLALATAPAVASAADPAEAALAQRDAYVSPRVMGPAAAAEEAALAKAAAELRDEGRPVKLAVVIGPVGAPSLQAYARRLATRLDFDGTLLVARTRGAVAAFGPRPTADMTRDLRAGRVGRIANPVERVARAARLAAPPPTDDDGALWRPAITLLALGLVGGGWAVAIGLGRQSRQQRRLLAEARARVRVRLDALRSHAVALARRGGLPDGERPHVEGALGGYAEVVAALAETRTVDAVAALDERVGSALSALIGVGERVGARHPRADIFAGLCSVDPAHGLAQDACEVEGRAGAPVCTGCAEAAASGERLSPRRIPAGGGAVSFTSAADSSQAGSPPLR